MRHENNFFVSRFIFWCYCIFMSLFGIVYLLKTSYNCTNQSECEKETSCDN